MKETTPVPGFRRATDAEIATARAWVEHYTADWMGHDVEDDKRREYEHALEVIIFTNGGRHQEPAHRIEQAIAKHYEECRRSHPTNGDWFACEARAIADAPPR